MSVATEFRSWQAKPPSALQQFARSSPALVALRTFVLAWFGGANLGIWGVRNVRGGTSLSSHAFGAAWDWSYRGIAGGRDAARAKALEVIEWLIANSAELGVQAIHDYQGSRIWRAGRGWKDQPKDAEGMGQSWGDWLHVEIFETAWGDDRPVGAKLQPTAPEVPARPVLRRGDSGPFVRLAQAIMKDRAGQPVTVDGQFGGQTETAVRNVQAFVKSPVTGVIDESFWHVLDVLNGQAG